MTKPLIFTISATWDDEAAVWTGHCDDIPAQRSARLRPEWLMPNMLDRITVDSEICGGRPCIRGLRVRVKDVLDMLAGASTRAEILEDYPYLEDEDITAALEFASRAADHPVLTAIEP